MARQSAGDDSKELVDCPLCDGEGQLERATILARLGMTDHARVAELSAQEAFRLVMKKQAAEEEANWRRFEAEIAKRANAIEDSFNKQVNAIRLEKETLERKLNDSVKAHETAVKQAQEKQRLADERAVQEQTASFREEKSALEQAHQSAVNELQLEKNRLAMELQQLREGQSAQLVQVRETDKATLLRQTQDEIAALKGQLAEAKGQAAALQKEREAAVAAIKTQLESEVAKVRGNVEDLNRKIEGYLSEIKQKQGRVQELEAELAKTARIGKREEMSFEEEARTWRGIYVSEKQNRMGDYIIGYRDAAGNVLEPRILIDNKDKGTITSEDIQKLLRDADARKLSVAALVAHDDSQLRQVDKEHRWASENGIWLLRTARAWLPRDLEVLRPVLDRMRTEGPDFLTKNAVLSAEIRKSLEDLDRVEAELRKIGKAVEAVQELVAAYRRKIQLACDSVGKAQPKAAAIEGGERAEKAGA
jgi:hypothetical protein